MPQQKTLLPQDQQKTLLQAYSVYLEGYDKLYVKCSPSRAELILRLEKQLQNPKTPLPTKLLDLLSPREQQHIFNNIIKRDSADAKIKLQASIMPFPIPIQKALYESFLQKQQSTPLLQQPVTSSSLQQSTPLLQQPVTPSSLQQPIKKQSSLQQQFQKPR